MTDRMLRRLGDVTNNFDSIRQPVTASRRIPGRYPYYGASGIIDYVESYLFDGDYLLVAEDGENLKTRSTPIAFKARGKFWVNNHAHVVQANRHAETSFLAYMLSITDISAFLTGTTQPKLSQAALASIPVLMPPKDEQRAIAEVLDALDDKIAANARLAKTAGDLAIALCSRPQALVPIGAIAEPTRTVVEPASIAEKQVWHFSLPAFDEGRRADHVEPQQIKSAKSLMSRPCLLVSKLNPRLPRLWDVPVLPLGVSVASTEFVVFESDVCSTSVLWALTSQSQFSSALEEKSTGTSGSHQRVRPADLNATPIGDPRSMPGVVLDQVTTLGQVRWQAVEESATLAATRDALLPHLMSGRLRVRDAENVVSDRV